MPPLVLLPVLIELVQDGFELKRMSQEAPHQDCKWPKLLAVSGSSQRIHAPQPASLELPVGKASDHDEKWHHDLQVFAYQLHEILGGSLSEIHLMSPGVIESRGGEDLSNTPSYLVQFYTALRYLPQTVMRSSSETPLRPTFSLRKNSVNVAVFLFFILFLSYVFR
jgi:hypothetical protein